MTLFPEMTAELREFDGTSVIPHVDDLARLRLTVFREYPYLYEGSLAAERSYLRRYAVTPGAFVILVMDDATVAGAATGMPLAEEPPEVTAPFAAAGLDAREFFYLGEMLLTAPYRARGLGSRLLTACVERIRREGAWQRITCATVERPDDHPARPAGYLPIDRFCHRHGFIRHPELRTLFSWREVGEEAETAKPMVFWIRETGTAVGTGQ